MNPTRSAFRRSGGAPRAWAEIWQCGDDVRVERRVQGHPPQIMKNRLCFKHRVLFMLRKYLNPSLLFPERHKLLPARLLPPAGGAAEKPTAKTEENGLEGVKGDTEESQEK